MMPLESSQAFLAFSRSKFLSRCLENWVYTNYVDGVVQRHPRYSSLPLQSNYLCHYDVIPFEEIQRAIMALESKICISSLVCDKIFRKLLNDNAYIFSTSTASTDVPSFLNGCQ